MADHRKPPVFIVGSPRSGTTLLRRILDRHPALAISDETRFFADIYQRRRVFGSLEKLQNRQRFADRFLATARFRRLGIDSGILRRRILEEANSYAILFDSILKSYAETCGKDRCGEKTPHHSFFTETLSTWYPGAPLIHLVRDPRDVVASLQRMPWAPTSIVNNSFLWVLFNRAAERSSHRPDYLLVHYEQLVACPEQELARICSHIGEDFTPSLLLPSEPGAASYSWPASTRGPLIKERFAKWREQLAPEDISIVEWIAGRKLDAYAYPRCAEPLSVAAAIRGLAGAGYDLTREQVVQFPYTWFRLTQPGNLAEQEYWKYRRAWNIVFPGQPHLNHRE